ncbi:hypothetical protein LTA6_001032 [Microbacterium sp. LTA6]
MGTDTNDGDLDTVSMRGEVRARDSSRRKGVRKGSRAVSANEASAIDEVR